MSAASRFSIVLLTVLVAGTVYVVYQTRGDTTLGLTLTTNPNLERGLVGHWTFDGPDVDWGSTTAEIKDVSGGGTHANASTSMSINSSLTAGVIGQALQFHGVQDEWARTPSSAPFTFSNAVSVAAWVRFDSKSGWDSIVHGGNDGWITAYWLGAWLRTSPSPQNWNWSINGNARIRYYTTIDTDRWYHVVGTYDGATSTLYIDGLAVDQATDTPQTLSQGWATFGTARNGGYPLDGAIDDVRIYDRALSAEEIKRLYARGATTRVAETITTNPNLERGLVGHWTFDGPDVDWASTTAEIKDVSGNEHHGDALGNASLSTSVMVGVSGQAYSNGVKVDDDNTYVRVPYHSDFNEIESAYTLAAWVLLDEDDPAFTEYRSGIFGVGSNDKFALLKGCGGGCMVGGKLRMALEHNGTFMYSGWVWPTEQWFHMAVTWDGATSTMYLNSVPVAEQALATPPAIDTNDIWIGKTFTSYDAQALRGSLDDVRIYNRALSAEEIKRLYALGATTRVAETLTTNPNLERGLVSHLTFDGPEMDWGSTTAEVRDRSGGVSWDAVNLSASNAPTPGVMGQGITLNGTNSYLQTTGLPDIVSSGYTLTAWVRRRATGHSYSGRIHNLGHSGSNYNTVVLQTYNTSAKCVLDGTVLQPGTITYDEWAFLACSYDRVTLRQYVNGSFTGSTTATSTGDTLDGRISWQDQSAAFPGDIDDVRIYNRALSATEIKRLYTLGN